MPNSFSIGREGEARAVKHLKKLNFKILERNFSGPFGEIDIIAKENSSIVFVEVKCRNSAEFGRPEEFVNKKKQSKIVKTALQYLKMKNLDDAETRFDVLTLDSSMNRFELIRSAFDSPAVYKY